MYTLFNLVAVASRSKRMESGSMTQVYIIHGYNASPAAHWFPWLQEKLREDGLSVETISMPHASAPDYFEWVTTLEMTIDTLDEDTYFVAHSLGCITLMRYLLKQSQKAVRIGGLLLVSGFTSSLPTLPSLDPFVAAPLNFNQLREMTANRLVIAAAVDEIVPTELSEQLATDLAADYYRIATTGHFLLEDGYDCFPLVYEQMKDFIE